MLATYRLPTYSRLPHRIYFGKFFYIYKNLHIEPFNVGYRRACGHVDVGFCPHQILAATLTLSQPLNLAPLIRACRDNSNVLPLLKTFNEELVERKCYNDTTLSFF